MLDIIFYKDLYHDVRTLSDCEIIKHFNTIGKSENRISNEDERNKRIKQRFEIKDDGYYIRKIKIICFINGPWWNLLNKYFYKIDEPHKIHLAAVIDLNYYKKYDDYYNRVKKYKNNKKSVLYEYNKSKKQKFYCHPFIKSNFIPDIYNIHTSKEKRSGILMSSSYNRSIEELGYQNNYINVDPLKLINDINNYRIYIGIFDRIEGYKQGSNITNEKLIGYITLFRVNNFITYEMIIGHGEYLHYGIMYHLHFYTFENYIYSNINLFNNIEYLIYGGYYHGNKNWGLLKWKKKLLFEPYELVCEN